MNELFTIQLTITNNLRNKKLLPLLITNNLISLSFSSKDSKFLWVQDSNLEKLKLNSLAIFMIIMRLISKKLMNKFMKY